MMFKTKDRTRKWVELVMIMETLRYHAMAHITGYHMDLHKLNDSNIELWLSGQIKLFQNEEERQVFLKQEEEKEKHSKTYDYVG